MLEASYDLLVGADGARSRLAGRAGGGVVQEALALLLLKLMGSSTKVEVSRLIQSKNKCLCSSSLRVRAEFQKQVPEFSFSQVQDGMEYKTLELPSLLPKADPNSDFITMFDQKRNATIIATPSTDGVHRLVNQFTA